MAAALLVMNVAFHIGQAAVHVPAISLYRDRHVVATAIQKKQPEMFAHRRAFAVDGGPALLDDKVRPWDSVKDVRLDNPQLRLGPRRVALWTVTLRNTSRTVAYRDVLYQALYKDASGAVVTERHDFVKQIFQPGESVTLEINDGFVEKPFASATIQVLAAEGLIPIGE